NLQLAISVLERRAKGDYSRDDTPDSFPPFVDGHARRASGISCWDLFDAFVKAVRPAENTVQRWRAVFLEMQREFAETGAAGITEAAARKWIASLVTSERTAKTVREVWLPASRRLFGWAKGHKHINENPFAGIKVDVPREARSRETKAFMPAE